MSGTRARRLSPTQVRVIGNDGGLAACASALLGLTRPYSALLGLDAGGADYLGPFFGFLRDQPAELGGRAGKRLAANGGQPRLHSGIGDRRIDSPVELVDDFS